MVQTAYDIITKQHNGVIKVESKKVKEQRLQFNYQPDENTRL